MSMAAPTFHVGAKIFPAKKANDHEWLQIIHSELEHPAQLYYANRCAISVPKQAALAPGSRLRLNENCAFKHIRKF
jgi:hypothetical protein